MNKKTQPHLRIVRGVPTRSFYRKGGEVARKVGDKLPEQQMRDFLKENL